VKVVAPFESPPECEALSLSSPFFLRQLFSLSHDLLFFFPSHPPLLHLLTLGLLRALSNWKFSESGVFSCGLSSLPPSPFMCKRMLCFTSPASLLSSKEWYNILFPGCLPPFLSSFFFPRCLVVTFQLV